MRHLTRDERLQALDEGLVERRRRHLDGCPVCRADVAALREVLAAVRETPVPEPSPLFWEYFSARVRQAVAEEPPARPRAWWLPAWRPLVASLSTAALLGLMLGGFWFTGRGTTEVSMRTPAVAAVVIAPDAGPATGTDDDWGFLLAVADDSAWSDDEGLAWSSRPGQAELTVPDLTNEEQAALVTLLNEAIAAPGPRSPNRPG